MKKVVNKGEWKILFKDFYNNNVSGGSSRWLVSPALVEVFIDGLLSSQKQELIRQLAEKIEKEKIQRVGEQTVADKGLINGMYWSEGFNQGLSKAIEIIKESEK